MANGFTYFLAVVFGLLFGSFANVAVLRAGDWKGVLAGRSRCPHCKHELMPLDLVPVLSYLWLRGRCRYCGKPISAQYPLVELSAALLAVLAVWYGVGIQQSFFLAAFLFFSLLFFLVIAVEDILSQEVSLPYCVLAGAFGLVGMAGSGAQDIVSLLGGLLFGAGIILAISLIWKLATGTDGMGSGDIWICGAVGAVVGWPLVIISFAVGVMTGAVVGVAAVGTSRAGMKTRLPFGPFLVFGLLVALVWGQSILRWYILPS